MKMAVASSNRKSLAIIAALTGLMALAQGCLSPGGNGDSYGGMKNDGSYYHVVDAATCAVSSQASSLAVHSRIRIESGKASIEGGCSSAASSREIALSELKSVDDSGRVFQYQGRVYELSTESGAKDLRQTLAICTTQQAGPPVWPWDQYQSRILAGREGDYAVAMDYVVHALNGTVPFATKVDSYFVQPVQFSSSVTERSFKGEGLEIISNMQATVGLDHVKRSAFTLGLRGATETREGLCHHLDLQRAASFSSEK